VTASGYDARRHELLGRYQALVARTRPLVAGSKFDLVLGEEPSTITVRFGFHWRQLRLSDGDYATLFIWQGTSFLTDFLFLAMILIECNARGNAAMGILPG
jgi:hypothetical protein